MEIFSLRIRELWNKWELRVLVLLSLTWQVILITLGSRRKHSKHTLVSFLVWITYLSADWLATVSLGTLANSQGDVDTSKSTKESRNNVLQALWAPFLLLHLGGPDTITAYSLEDNSLWLRHLLGLLVQVSVAFYIFIRSWSTNALTFIAIPVFVSGIIKYSERTWVLRSASPDHFEDSLLPDMTVQAPDWKPKPGSDNPELQYIHNGYSLFPFLKHLYANLSLRFAEGQRSYSLIVKDAEQKPWEYAFKLIEVQLGLLYDVLYTKATIIYRKVGLIFRFISFFSVVSALAAFGAVIDNHAYSRVDIVITYILFIGAISLEIYGLMSLLSSDWTIRWMSKKQSFLSNFMNYTISCCRPEKKRWSKCMAQLNLVDFCLKNRVIRYTGFDVLFTIYFKLELYRQRKWKEVDDDDLQRMIFDKLREKYKNYKDRGFDGKYLKDLLSHKGNHVVEKKFFEVIRWSFEVEFNHSILLWHVATNICYYSDAEKQQDKENKVSKKLSDYMLYVLLMRPLMLPKWIDRVTHVRDTFKEAIRLFHRKKFPVKESAPACKMLIQVHTQCQVLEALRKEKSGRSVLLDACRLALQLQNQLSSEDRWKAICEMWIEMLTYAASQCEWASHAQQLRRGGELLTHVALLMADLGLSEQFDIGRRGPPIDNQNKGWGCLRAKAKLSSLL